MGVHATVGPSREEGTTGGDEAVADATAVWEADERVRLDSGGLSRRNDMKWFKSSLKMWTQVSGVRS